MLKHAKKQKKKGLDEHTGGVVKSNKLSVLLVVLLAFIGIFSWHKITNNHDQIKKPATENVSKKNPTLNEVVKAEAELESKKYIEGITPESVLAKVNKLRAEAGVPPLVLDERLNVSAMLKAQDMVDNGYYGHKNPTTGKRGASYVFDLTGQECSYAGENLMESVGSHNNLESLINGWKESKSHYEAMIDPKYHTIGFAKMTKFKDGLTYLYAVQHFCQKR